MGIVKAKELIQDADIRSKRYMEKVIEETGFLGYSVSEKSFRVVCDRIKKKYYRIGVIHNWDPAKDSQYVIVYYYKGKSNKRIYFAEFQVRKKKSNEYKVVTYFYSKKPKKENLNAAYNIKKISKMLKNKESTEITCIQCNRRIHWLDIKAKTIEKRVEHVKNKYCGCKKGINM